MYKVIRKVNPCRANPSSLIANARNIRGRATCWKNAEGGTPFRILESAIAVALNTLKADHIVWICSQCQNEIVSSNCYRPLTHSRLYWVVNCVRACLLLGCGITLHIRHAIEGVACVRWKSRLATALFRRWSWFSKSVTTAGDGRIRLE